MKKLLVLLLTLTLLVACNKGTENTTNTAENSASKETNQATETTDNKKVKIGVIKFIDHVSLDAAKDGFLQELKDEGIDYELVDLSANGDVSLISTLAKQLESEQVDLIYAIATPSAQGAKNVIKDKPIVFSAVTDPIGAGLVESFEKPEANVTGVSDYIDPNVQIEDFLKLYPDTKTFGVLYSTSEQNSQVQVEELEKALDAKGIKLEKVGINNVNDIPQAIASLSTKIDALFAITDNLVANAAPIVAEDLLQENIPSVSAEEGQVKEGLLMSKGVNYEEQGKQAAKLAVKILNGEEVKNIPVEYNEINDQLVNEDTAKKLGVDLNSEVLKDAKLEK
jgi:putative ABC transport system substrate-binding protein